MCHALVAYFDIEFGLGHKKIFFSTGPHAKYTHWKQTVFYLDTDLPVTPGDVIRGTLEAKPSKSNPRDYDVEVMVDLNGKDMKHQGKQFFRIR